MLKVYIVTVVISSVFLIQIPSYNYVFGSLHIPAQMDITPQKQLLMFLDNMFWSALSAEIKTSVRSCIHCLSTVGGKKVSCPYGLAVNGTTANGLLQFDYIDVAIADSGEKHVLSFRDDHSNYF